jgi:hypothetical protein
MNVLRDSVSASSLALVKQGTTYDAQVTKEKKLAESKKKLAEAQKKESSMSKSAAISAAGGPVAALTNKLDALKSILGETGGSSGMGLLTLGVAGAIAMVAALTVAVVAAGIALTRFILKSADAARSANLTREAWSGTAKNASNLGTQIDALSMKVPTSKEKLNELAISLMKVKLSGAATVDAFNAIGQASAALGDEAGNKLKEFIERGRMVGRMSINPAEMLEGFGNLNFDDIAVSLAGGMHISVAAARKALFEGRVKIDDGAKAIRDAVEKRFGGINLRKMMSFEVMSQKLSERFASLTKDVNLEPLLKPLAALGKLFDDSTVTGQTLKLLVTEFGKGMVAGLVKGIPLAKAFFQGLVIGALHTYIAFLKVRKALQETFGDSKMLKDVDMLQVSLTAGKYAAMGIALAIVSIGAVMVAGIAPVVAFTVNMIRTVKSIKETVQGLDWKAVGKSIPDGIVDGLKEGTNGVFTAISDLAEGTKKKFKIALGIASPSKAFRQYGQDIDEGAAQGVQKNGRAQAAVETMVSVPSSGGSSSGGASARGGAPLVLHLHFEGLGSGSGSSAAAALSEPSFLAKLTKAVEDALVSAGIPVLS